jgi:hypothetical protein
MDSSAGFSELVDAASKLVKEKYPLASFLEADGVSPNGPTSEMKDVSNWRFVFVTEDYGTAFVTSGGQNSFGPVRYTGEPWVDDRPVPWPIKMEPDEALGLVRNAGYTTPFIGVSLRWPLFPGITQPHYIFEMSDADDSYVFVGVNDRSVQVHR